MSCDRSTVPSTVAAASAVFVVTVLMVSVTGTPGTTPAEVNRTAEITDSNCATGVKARAASCTSTTVTSGPSAASPAATDCVRVAPPGTTVTDSGVPPAALLTISAVASSQSAGATTTTSHRSVIVSAVRILRSRMLRPATATNALGTSRPSRVPLPAATITTPTSAEPTAFTLDALRS